MAEKTFFQNLVSAIKDEDTHLAVNSTASGEFTGWMDTGSLALNALMSGSIYGGMPNNKRTMFAGESAVGKTFLALGNVKHFLDSNPTGGVIYYDAESALTKSMLTERDIDTNRVIIVDIATIQKFRTHVMKFITAYNGQPEKTRPPMLLVLDSLGNLSTSKEVEDIEAGKDTKDMTRSQLIRGCFRAITVPLAKVRVPLILTNHTYATFGMFPTQELSGGGGSRYAADNILFLSKSQDKTAAGEHIGGFITARNFKSRFTREKATVKLRLSYTTGLDRYYGLLEIAERGGLVTQVAKKFTLPDGTQAKESVIYRSPLKYFTKEFLDQIDKVSGEIFKYGGKLEDKAETLIDDDGNTDSEVLID